MADCVRRVPRVLGALRPRLPVSRGVHGRPALPLARLHAPSGDLGDSARHRKLQTGAAGTGRVDRDYDATGDAQPVHTGTDSQRDTERFCLSDSVPL